MELKEKIDIAKEKLANYRELFRNLFLLFIATVIGMATVIYKIFINDELPFKYLFIGLILFIICLALFKYLFSIWSKMENIIEEFENVE